jgi:GAF domain-containing protein
MTTRPPTAQRPGPGRLVCCLTDLAGTPDDLPHLDTQLATLAALTADRVAAVDYASVTALRDGGYVTVGASGDLARIVDQAQYDDDAGPCLDSVGTGMPVAVPDIRTALRWPGFRDEAFRVGLRASLSVPLFAGSGAPIAALNLYGHDHAAMAPLIEAVRETFEAGNGGRSGTPAAALDDGALELVTGLGEALAVRATIQRAIGVLIAGRGCTAREGYRILRASAAEAGTDLRRAATDLLAE